MNLPPKFSYQTIVPRELVELRGVPVVPPVRLGPGDGVDLWFHVEAGEVSLRHAGSSLEGARLGLLFTLRERTMRLIVAQVLRADGHG
jgi:hypothetical protein